MKTVTKVALGLAVCAVTTLTSGFAVAEVKAPSYQMTVIADDAYGKNIVSGKYRDAIAKLSAANKRYERGFEAQNNLCVAYTKSNELGKAEVACNSAIEIVKNHPFFDGSARFYSTYEQSEMNKDLAIALSNRGVLKAVLGNTELAASDFLAAEKLKTGLEAPTVNLARVER